ncbi:MAG: alpha-N-acetylglucosaminidase N-terminal domain-containing protein, partial [Bacteroidales bacterium]|nr:alpha-N-acetylglucosaminidase N-terminal domain-containing protein [Bacteroidales bacterium]
MKSFKIILLVTAFAISTVASAAPKWKDKGTKAVYDLIERVTPGYSSSFVLKLDSNQEPEYYSYSTSKDKILLEGNTTIALCVAYYQYLRQCCNVNLSFCGSHVELPGRLPLPQTVKGKINGPYRSFFNYCSFSYTAAWWTWEDWQWTIDFLAMNGINMPLQVVGLEGVWYNSLLKIGYTDLEARQYLCGPAYFAWQWMGNIESF